MESTNKKVIAVVGATGQQGGAVLRALQAGKQFKVRALTRNTVKHRGLADEVVASPRGLPTCKHQVGAHFRCSPRVVLLVAAIREDGFSREPPRIIRSKKYGHARDVLGLADFRPSRRPLRAPL